MKLILFLLLFYSFAAVASDDLLKIKEEFGFLPGEVYPYELDEFRLKAPYTATDVPIYSEELQNIFSGLTVWILSNTKIIISLTANRVFENTKECKEEKDKLKEYLSVFFKKPYPAPHVSFHYVSDDGTIAAGVRCSQAYMYNPFPILEINITHIESDKKRDELFEKEFE